MSSFEVIERSRRYILGEGEESYGIWDRRGRDEPLERFPFTEEGFDAAQARFAELRRLDRRSRDVAAKVIAGATWTGLVLWIVSGLFTIIGPFAVSVFLTGPVADAVSVADVIAYRIALGGVLALAALVLLRRLEGGRGVSERGGEISSWDRGLAIVAGVGLAVWILSGLVIRIIQPAGPELSFVPLTRPSGVFIAVSVVEALAFRVWVAAVVIFSVRRFGPRPTTA
jgi:hypothetical protein